MAGADQISFLPIDIKISILSRLSITDAVRTSILARSWRDLWTLLPSLRIFGSYEDRLGDLHVASSWIERICLLISSLQGPLVNFELFDYFSSDRSALLQSLLNILLQKEKGKGGLQTLSLFSFHDRPLLHLPLFHSLKELRLWGCHLVLPAAFRGFNRLATLSLDNVQITNDHLHLLIHASNNLTSLSIACLPSEHPLSVNLTLPLLRHLNFDINDSVEKVSVVSAPCLEQAHIFNSCRKDSSSSQKLALVTLGLVTGVATVSSLNLDSDVLESLSLVTLPSNFTFPLLRCLTVILDSNTMDKRVYDAFIWLLRSMPILEELQLEVYNHPSQTNRIAILMRELLVKKQDGISCLDQTLGSVKISVCPCANVMTDTTVVKFFLLNARVLKLMTIEYWTDFSVESGMIEELQKAEAASSDAKVVIFSRKENATISVK